MNKIKKLQKKLNEMKKKDNTQNPNQTSQNKQDMHSSNSTSDSNTAPKKTVPDKTSPSNTNQSSPKSSNSQTKEAVKNKTRNPEKNTSTPTPSPNVDQDSNSSSTNLEKINTNTSSKNINKAISPDKPDKSTKSGNKKNRDEIEKQENPSLNQTNHEKRNNTITEINQSNKNKKDTTDPKIHKNDQGKSQKTKTSKLTPLKSLNQKSKKQTNNTKKNNGKTFIELPEYIKIGKMKIKTRLLLTIAYILLGLIISGGVLSYLYFILIDIEPPAKSLIKINSDYVFPKKEPTHVFTRSYKVTQPSIPRTEESPLNGKLFTKEEIKKLEDRRPIAIMINNHSWARPQSNLTKADIVYETLVEAGITRYLAFYWSEDVQEVGPIRSVRNYHLEMLSGYDAILAHDGQAYADDPRVDAAGNIYRYKIKDVDTYGAWRWNDGRRYAPHNEYTNPMKIWDFAKQQGWDEFPEISNWDFKKDALINDRADNSVVEVSFWKWVSNGNNYNVVWKYDKINNTYYREVGGKKDIDQKTNSQINPKVVIIQEVEMISTGNSKGHIIIETVGDGNAKILQDGKVHEATWKKSSRTSRTKYYDKDGEEFKFNRGQIWIQAVPEKNGEFTIIK